MVCFARFISSAESALSALPVFGAVQIEEKEREREAKDEQRVIKGCVPVQRDFRVRMQNAFLEIIEEDGGDGYGENK